MVEITGTSNANIAVETRNTPGVAKSGEVKKGISEMKQIDPQSNVAEAPKKGGGSAELFKGVNLDVTT